MKKTLLIPTLLTVASTPLISLVGCGKNEFQVTMEEMVNAICLSGVDYLQCDSWDEGAREDGSIVITNNKSWFSPNIYHSIVDTYDSSGQEESYEEKFVIKKGDNYEMFSRTNPEAQTWQHDESVDHFQFETILKLGVEEFTLFKLFFVYGETFKFDNDNKCYWSTMLDGGKEDKIQFYFKDKKLLKHDCIGKGDFLNGKNSITLTYDEITPIPPEPGV